MLILMDFTVISEKKADKAYIFFMKTRGSPKKERFSSSDVAVTETTPLKEVERPILSEWYHLTTQVGEQRISVPAKHDRHNKY